MAGLLQIVMAVSTAAFAADKVPEFDVGPTCKAAAATNVRAVNNDDTACKRDESQARDKLGDTWVQFTPGQKAQCVRLSTLGGSPSYVELLTCLELNKAAAELPHESKADNVGKR